MKEKVSELLTLFKTERESFREIESQFPPYFGDYRKVNYFREKKSYLSNFGESQVLEKVSHFLMKFILRTECIGQLLTSKWKSLMRSV